MSIKWVLLNIIIILYLINRGLYIKFGQQIAQQSALLPSQYVETFKVLYDNAPITSYEEISKVFEKDFNKKRACCFLSNVN